MRGQARSLNNTIPGCTSLLAGLWMVHHRGTSGQPASRRARLKVSRMFELAAGTYSSLTPFRGGQSMGRDALRGKGAFRLFRGLRRVIMMAPVG